MTLFHPQATHTRKLNMEAKGNSSTTHCICFCVVVTAIKNIEKQETCDITLGREKGTDSEEGKEERAEWMWGETK